MNKNNNFGIVNSDWLHCASIQQQKKSVELLILSNSI